MLIQTLKKTGNYLPGQPNPNYWRRVEYEKKKRKRTYVDYGYRLDNTYTYRIRARNSGGASAYSNTTQQTIPSGPPSTPIAFPGAVGFGYDQRHAFAGPINPLILKVTNLNDSGTGSFREALTNPNPRVIIFETSGTIELLSRLVVTSPYCYLAGQTAPSPGITVRGFPIFYETGCHHILVRHIRFRPDPMDNQDCFTVWLDNSHHLFWNHCSFSWARDELVGIDCGPRLDAYIDIQDCIFSEPLAWSGSGTFEAPNAWAASLIVGQEFVSFTGNVFAQCYNRSPVIKSDPSITTVWNFSNNLIHNPVEKCSAFYGDGSTGLFTGIYEGNYVIAGLNTRTDGNIFMAATGTEVGSQLYLNDNTRTGAFVMPEWGIFSSGIDPRVGSPPSNAILPNGYTPSSSIDLPDLLLPKVGARPLDRDAVDIRIITDVTNHTGEWISDPADVGGWPVLAENTRVLTPPSNPYAIGGSGYTLLEEWIENYTAEVQVV